MRDYAKKVKMKSKNASVAPQRLISAAKKAMKIGKAVFDQGKRLVLQALGRPVPKQSSKRDSDDGSKREAFQIPDHLDLDDLEGIIKDSKCRRMCTSNGITPRDMRNCFHKMDPFGKGVCVTGDFLMALVRVTSDFEGVDVLSLKSAMRREVMELDELRKRFESVIRSMTLVDSQLRQMPEEMINQSFEAAKQENQTTSGAAETAAAAAEAGEAGEVGSAMADIEELRRLQDENAWLHARLVEITKGMRVKQLAGGSKAVVSLLQNEVRVHQEEDSQMATPASPREPAAAGMRSGDPSGIDYPGGWCGR
jgi:hypothetical protein